MLDHKNSLNYSGNEDSLTVVPDPEIQGEILTGRNYAVCEKAWIGDICPGVIQRCYTEFGNGFYPFDYQFLYGTFTYTNEAIIGRIGIGGGRGREFFECPGKYDEIGNFHIEK